jgi:hypothetical protein
MYCFDSQSRNSYKCVQNVVERELVLEINIFEKEHVYVITAVTKELVLARWCRRQQRTVVECSSPPTARVLDARNKSLLFG